MYYMYCVTGSYRRRHLNYINWAFMYFTPAKFLSLQVIPNAMRTRCFRYFRKMGRPSHNFFVVIFFFKCNPPDFKFCHGKLNNNKKKTIWGNVNLESAFTAINNIKILRENRPKINITSYGENVYHLTKAYRDKI